MAWDATRPVPWRRLLTEWAIVGALMIVITVTFTRNPMGAALAAIVLGGGIYVAVGAVMAKFGYQRKTIRAARDAAAAQRRAASAPSGRPRPAPTSRTGGSSARPGGNKRRR